MRQRYFRFILLVILASSMVMPSAYAKYPQTITTTTKFVNLPRPKDDPRWAKAFANWDKRVDQNKVVAALKIFESLGKDKPEKFDVQLWLCRVYYMMGMRTNSQSKRAGWMNKSVNAAEKALKIKPGDENALYWKFAGVLHVREITPPEFAQLRKFGSKYINVREIQVPKDNLLWEKAMKHWDARFSREEGPRAIALFEKLEREYPDRVEPKLWLCRANYWMHFLEKTKQAKGKCLLKAANWGRKATKIEPRNAAASYFTAAALGQYASHTSRANIIKYSLEIMDQLQLVMEEDPQYFYGGVSQYLALSFARAGFIISKTLELVGFSEKVALRSTTFASKFQPHYIRNFYALGEMYIARGEMDKAKKALDRVVKADPTILKLQEPENRVAQQLAKDLLKKHFSK